MKRDKNKKIEILPHEALQSERMIEQVDLMSRERMAYLMILVGAVLVFVGVLY